MELWQIEACVQLLSQNGETNVAVVEGGNRVYMHSTYYGESRYHVVSRSSDGDVVIDQTDHAEKYQQRVTLEEQEVEPLLRSLLLWHLDKVRKQNERSHPVGDDGLGDLEGYPF